MKHVLILILIATLSACSTKLGVKPVEVTTAKMSAAQSVVYYLPKVRYDIVATYTLKSCDQPAEADLTVKASPAFFHDPDRWYEVDYSSLTSGMKTTDMQLTLWPNGTLKSINASSEDKTSDVAASVGKGLVHLSLPKLNTLRANEKESVCETALRELKESTAEIKKLEEGERDAQTGKKTAHGMNDFRAELARLLQKASASKEDEQRIRDLNDTISALEEKAKPQKKKQTLALEVLTETVTVSFEPTWNYRATVVEPGPKARSWGLSGLLCVQVDDGSAQKCDGTPAIAKPETPPQPPGEGLVYRQPIAARLLVCRGTNGSCIGRGDNLVEAETSVPQLGVMARLPLQNGPFQSNSIGAEFGPDGGLVKFAFKDTGGAAGAAGTFDSLAGQYAGYRADQEAKKEAARVRDSAVGQDEHATAALEAEIARIEAEIKLQKLKQELDQLTQQ